MLQGQLPFQPLLVLSFADLHFQGANHLLPIDASIHFRARVAVDDLKHFGRLQLGPDIVPRLLPGADVHAQLTLPHSEDERPPLLPAAQPIQPEKDLNYLPST
jgi:hypothetical protein